MPEWDNPQAHQEGWGLYRTMGTDDVGDIRLERIDDLALFESDADAWLFVARKAVEEDSDYHLEALKIIEMNNSTEFENIENHVCPILGINSISSFFVRLKNG